MGVDVLALPMAEARKKILSDFKDVLSHSKGKGGLWILHAVKEENVDGITATFVKMNFYSGETYYRALNVDWGHSFYDCPIEWLDQIKVNTEGGADWMAKARKHHRTLQVDLSGVRFEMAGRKMEVISRLQGIWWKVYDESRQNHYKMRDSMIREYVV